MDEFVDEVVGIFNRADPGTRASHLTYLRCPPHSDVLAKSCLVTSQVQPAQRDNILQQMRLPCEGGSVQSVLLILVNPALWAVSLLPVVWPAAIGRSRMEPQGPLDGLWFLWN